jgi:hypothetical protein
MEVFREETGRDEFDGSQSLEDSLPPGYVGKVHNRMILTSVHEMRNKRNWSYRNICGFFMGKIWGGLEEPDYKTDQ